jgi:hypothetical protein
MAAPIRAATDSTCASVANWSRRVYRGENVLQSTAKRQTDGQAPVVNGASPWAKKLPWIDGVAALSAGALMFAFRGLLSDFYGLSYQLVTSIALVNMLYSVFGLTLGLLRRRPAWLLTALISANLGWAAACIVFAVRAPASATIWGYGQLVGEGAFVAALALLEWRHRRAILARPA